MRNGNTQTGQLDAVSSQTRMADLPQVQMGFKTMQSFELLQRAAGLLCASSIVPKNYQGRDNLPNCVVALNMANRIGADPLMVMQSLYVVHGNPSWSAQFVIACFNQCGRYSTISYRWQNKPATQGVITDEWGCTAYATELATGGEVEGPLVTIKMAKTEGWYDKPGSKWKTIPELMLMYRAGAWLQRTHAPEISMGLRTAEEERDIMEAVPQGDGTFAVEAPAKVAEANVISQLDNLAGAEEPTENHPSYDVARIKEITKSILKRRTRATFGADWINVVREFGDEIPVELSVLFDERVAHFDAADEIKAGHAAPETTSGPTAGEITAAIVRATTLEQVAEQRDLARSLPEAEQEAITATAQAKVRTLVPVSNDGADELFGAG